MALLSDSATYLIGRGLASGVAFAAIAAYTHLLTPEEYGYYALTISAVGLFNTVLFQWIRFGLTRFLAVYDERKESFLSTVLGTFLASAALATLIGGVIWIFLRGFSWQLLVPIGIAVLLAQAWFELNLELARARLHASSYGILSTVKALLALVGGVVLIRNGMGEYGPLVALVVAMPLAVVLVRRRPWLQANAMKAHADIAKQLLVYGYPLIATAVFAFVINTTDRFMIAWILGAGKAGEYAPSYDIAQQSLGMLMLSVYLAAFPRIAYALKAGGTEHAHTVVESYHTIFVGIGVPAAAGLALIATNVASLFLGSDYHASAEKIIPIIAVATLLSGTKAYYFDMSFQLSNRTMPLVWVGAFGAVMNVCLNLFLIPKFGILGAAYSTAISFGAALTMTAIWSRMAFRVPVFSTNVLKAVFASLVMSAILWPIRNMTGTLALLLQLLLGAATYLAMIVMTDMYNVRKRIMSYLG